VLALVSVSWFTRPIETRVETAPHVTPAERLAEIARRLSVAKAERDETRGRVRHYLQHKTDTRTCFVANRFFAAVGAMEMDPLLRALESEQRRQDERFDALLAERANLMAKTGAVR
jgi:hypothetical protein